MEISAILWFISLAKLPSKLSMCAHGKISFFYGWVWLCVYIFMYVTQTLQILFFCIFNYCHQCANIGGAYVFLVNVSFSLDKYPEVLERQSSLLQTFLSSRQCGYQITFSPTVEEVAFSAYIYSPTVLSKSSARWKKKDLCPKFISDSLEQYTAKVGEISNPSLSKAKQIALFGDTGKLAK